MLKAFYLLAALTLLEGIVSVASGVKYYLFVRRELRRRTRTDYLPKVALIAPCRGIDPGFEENIRAIMGQDYPSYEVIFVTSDESDSSYQALSALIGESRVRARLITAGAAVDRGQKVHNLIRAVDAVGSEAEVLAFVDSDARPHSTWLRELVAPLADPQVGASTGYRWYLPVGGGFFSVLRSAWNAGVATLLGDHKHNFAWGGSMAIRREVFESAHVLKYWEKAVSDDYALSRAVKDAGYYVKFVPSCMVVTYEDCSLRELLEWSARQIIITKVYSPRVWRLGAISQIGFNVTLYLGLFVTLRALLAGQSWLAPLGLLAAILSLGAVKGALRLFSIRMILTRHRRELNRYWWGYVLLAPLVALTTLYAMLKSFTTNTITWRGITYQMMSPFETKIIRQG